MHLLTVILTTDSIASIWSHTH